jgi:proteasome lid subunit RPN8/RPN11
VIRFEPEALAAIRRHGESSYPEECCGALLGHVGSGCRQVSAALELDNARETERRRRFRIGPEEYRRAESAAATQGLELVGFYHSHPDHPARPSAYDLEHALPWHAYVVLAVAACGAGECTAWVLAPDRSRFEPEGPCA